MGTAIIIVAIPAKKPDIDNTSTNSYPRRTKVDHAKLRKHSAPTLKGTGRSKTPAPMKQSTPTHADKEDTAKVKAFLAP